MSRYKKADSAQYNHALETVGEVERYPILAIPERGLTKETCEAWGIRTGLSTTDGLTPVAHYLPVTKKGKLVGFLKRKLDVPKKKAWSVVGVVEIDCDLLGTTLCQETDQRRRMVFIAEGFYDGPAVWQTLMQEQQVPGKYLPSVVSIPLGIGNKGENARQSVSNNRHFLERYEHHVFAFDNDEPGREGMEECLRIFPDALYAELERNDPNSYLMDDPAPKDLYWALRKPKEYQPDSIQRGAVSIDEIMTPIKPGIMVPCIPKASKMLGGFREEEMTILLGPAGTGKTTLLAEIGMSLLQQGQKVDFLFAEEPMLKAQQRYICLDNKVPLNVFRRNPNILTREQVQASMDKLVNDNTLWLDTKASFGKLNPDNLIRRLQWSHGMGFTYGLIDHLTMVGGYGTKSDAKVLDDLLLALAEHVTSTGQGIIAISHITRKNRPAPKEKDGSTKYPHWLEVRKEDARGSGAFEQLTWNNLCLEPEVNEDGTLTRTRIRIDKARETGWVGMADEYRMNANTGRVEAIGLD